MSKRFVATILIFIIATITFLPWLGLTPFHTKGEPREAIVALSMLQSGNWILPVSFGIDIPYKPPFLAWCIAFLSLPFGEVNEFTSRLPSAIAAIVMAVSLCCFIQGRTKLSSIAPLSALVMISTIEVWRAGMACRVDMVLTAFIFGAMIALYRYRESGYRGIPIVAILCMTCAVLTKGPIGMILPCLVAGIYGLLRGDRFTPLFLRMSAIGFTSLIIPSAYYYSAFLHGDDEFRELVIEENIGRMTGNMSYESHVKPVWYNFATVALGMLPYTIIAIFAAFVARYRKSSLSKKFSAIRQADPLTLFAATATLTVFIFYCIPESKRSVYLLPIYPFLSYFTVMLISWLANRKPALVKTYSIIISSVATLASIAAIALICGAPLPDSVRVATLPSIPLAILLVGITLFAAAHIIYTLRSNKSATAHRQAIIATIATLWLISGSILPAVLSPKSDRDVANDIARIVPEGNIYVYMTNEFPRFYTINHYLSDRLRPYSTSHASGYLLLDGTDEELSEWQRQYGSKYRIKEVYYTDHRSCDRRKPIRLLHFDKID